MKIRKGEVVDVQSSRKGRYVGKATEDFDTEKDEWYPMVLWQDDLVSGLSTDWAKGESIPARRGICVVTRRKSQVAKPETFGGPVTLDLFGKDHWSLLAYFDTLVMDRLSIDKRKMRCNFRRHQHYNVNVGLWDEKYGTVIKNGIVLGEHDDWDCYEDLKNVGLVQKNDGLKPVLTVEGKRVTQKLKDHKAKGGTFANFQNV